MAIGHFSYQPKLRVAIVVRHKQKYVKISVNYFKMSNRTINFRHFKIIYRYF
jgi:hypothetical protein